MKTNNNTHKTTQETLEATYRTDFVRMSKNYDDLGRNVVATFKTLQDIERKFAPLLSRNADNPVFMFTKDLIDTEVKNRYGMHPKMYGRLLNSVEQFYAKNRMTKRLPMVDLVSSRSVHYGEGLFKIKEIDAKEYIEKNKISRKYKISNVFQLDIDGCEESIYIENMKRIPYKYIILRPKLGTSGMPTLNSWEILFSNKDLGYNVEHIDTDRNPRYNGTM